MSRPLNSSSSSTPCPRERTCTWWRGSSQRWTSAISGTSHPLRAHWPWTTSAITSCSQSFRLCQEKRSRAPSWKTRRFWQCLTLTLWHKMSWIVSYSESMRMLWRPQHVSKPSSNTTSSSANIPSPRCSRTSEYAHFNCTWSHTKSLTWGRSPLSLPSLLTWLRWSWQSWLHLDRSRPRLTPTQSCSYRPRRTRMSRHTRTRSSWERSSSRTRRICCSRWHWFSRTRS